MSDTLFPEMEKTIDVWADTLSLPQKCADPDCKDMLVWAVVVKTGAKMCFTVPVTEIRRYECVPFDAPPQAMPREVAVMPFARNHWSVCPGRDKFRRKKR